MWGVLCALERQQAGALSERVANMQRVMRGRLAHMDAASACLSTAVKIDEVALRLDGLLAENRVKIRRIRRQQVLALRASEHAHHARGELEFLADLPAKQTWMEVHARYPLLNVIG
jgi:hypothetical protein